MIRSDQIPPEAVEAAREAWDGYYNWHQFLAAALSAWPNVTTTSWFENGVRKAVLNIPLPLESNNAEG